MQTQTKTPHTGEHPATIEGIYAADSPRLRRYAMKKGCSPEEADDLVNSAFCNYIAYVKSHPEITILKPISYLATSIHHLLVDKVRQEKRNMTVSLDDEENPVDPSDKGQAVAATNREIDDREYFKKVLQPNMNGFSEYESKLIWYHLIKDLKPKQIADLLGEPYETTSINCNRVKSKLRGRMRTKVKEL